MTLRTKEVNVTQMTDPKFLTLTGAPANQVAFKVLRSEEGDSMGAKTVPPKGVKRRVRSDSAVLYLDFSLEVSDEDIGELMVEFGLDDYTIETSDKGKRAVCRSADEGVQTMQVSLSPTCKATVVRSVPATEPAPATSAGLQVIALEFKKDVYADEVQVRSLLRADFIDLAENTVENSDTVFRVTRASSDAETETRRMELSPGLVAVVVRADVVDVPSSIVEVVSEAAYGNWGWGQLDFYASMADVQFCDLAEEASYKLGQVVRNILFYSETPLTLRKELVARAAEQFSSYIGGLIDALPAKVVAVTRNDLKHKESAMSDKSTQPAAGDTPAAAAVEVTPDTQPITRAEIGQVVADAVAQALAARSEKAPEPAELTAQPESIVGVDQITRSLADVAATLSTLGERLSGLEGRTVVRSDAVDSAQETPPKAAPFQGVFARSMTR